MRTVLTLLVLSALACAPVYAADRADDFILHVDRDGAGVILRRLSIEQHVDIPVADWPGMRAAAVTSPAALDAWFVTHLNGAWNPWWTGLLPAQRTGLRATILLGQ